MVDIYGDSYFSVLAGVHKWCKLCVRVHCNRVRTLKTTLAYDFRDVKYISIYKLRQIPILNGKANPQNLKMFGYLCILEKFRFFFKQTLNDLYCYSPQCVKKISKETFIRRVTTCLTTSTNSLNTSSLSKT